MGQENKSELSDILPELHDQQGNFSLQSAPAPAAAPANNNQAAPAAPQSESDPVNNFGAGLAGAVAGKVFGAPVEKPVNPNLIPAQSDLAAKSAVLESQKNNLASHQQTYAQELDRLRLEKAAADAALNDAGTAFHEATAHARSLNALPEPIQIAPEPEAPKLSAGAERHTNKMSEIRQGNKVQRGLEGVKEFSGTGGNLSGYTRNSRLIVPHELANAPVHTPDQLEALRRLEQAEASHQQAIRDAAEAKLKLERSKTPNTVIKSQNAVTTAEAAHSGAAAKLAELEKAKPSVLQRVGYNIGKLPYFNILSGALSGAELAHAYDAYQKGHITEAALAAMAGVGGGISLLPHPAAKAIGFGMQLPEMGYQAYRAIKN
jgi:hypothetical protein